MLSHTLGLDIQLEGDYGPSLQTTQGIGKQLANISCDRVNHIRLSESGTGPLRDTIAEPDTRALPYPPRIMPPAPPPPLTPPPIGPRIICNIVRPVTNRRKVKADAKQQAKADVAK